MENVRKCPQCGTDLPANVPEEQCPKCLLQVGMGTQTIDPSSGASEKQNRPPTPAELAGHFPQLEILELLGQGGMGIVYKARQPRLERLIALKILPAEPAGDPSFAERFTREARALARLSHPNVVGVYDFGETGGIFYLLMEYVDGLNLRQLERSGGLEPREALQVVPAICDALQYAHDQGIVHRDIKPENILIDKAGRVKIADFGLAKMLGRAGPELHLTQSEQIMGTVSYMAPEQMERPLEVDHRADIYSLGVVFYEMLTGELPVGKFAPPSQKVQIDLRLDEVVLRALEKERERRYQEARDVKSDLENISKTSNWPHSEDESRQPDADFFSANQAVKGPAIGLVATGIFNWVLIPVYTLLALYLLAGEVAAGPRFGIGLLLVAVIAISSFMIFAGLKMKGLEARGIAMTASFLAMIISPGNLIGLPIGIWALVVLTRPETKRAFQQKAENSEIGLPTAASVASSSGQGGARSLFFSTATVFLISIGVIILLGISATITFLALPALTRDRNYLRSPVSESTVLESFTTADRTISQDLITTNGVWFVSTDGEKAVRLFEVSPGALDPGVLFYGAQLKTEGLKGRAYLEMWCRFPGRGEFFSRGLNNVVSGTTDWINCQTPFFLKQGEQPDLVRLNVVVEGPGKIWIRDVALSHAASR